MKKSLLAAVAALAIVGCTQNEEIENAGNKAEISFGTMVSKTTRAAVTDLDVLKQANVGFTVYAYNTGSKTMSVAAASDLVPFMSNVKVTYDTQWNLSGGPYYWPLNANIQFFAYANPGVGTLAYKAPADSQVYPAVTYTVADVNGQTDFVVAKATDKTKTDDSVVLGFAHALTQVNFSVKGADKYTYKLTSITLKGVANEGTYNWGAEANSEWGDVSGTATYVYTLKSTPSVTGTKAISIGATDAALMLMPQAMPAEADKVTIEVVYKVYDGETAITDTVTSSIDLKGTTDWAAGKKIRYTLELANKGAAVSFAPEVGEWEAETDPFNPTPAK